MSIKLSQFTLRDMFIAVAAIAAVIGIQMAFSDFASPSDWSNLRVVLGWYLLATCLATALSLTGRYAVRSTFLAVALFGWSYFAFVLKFGEVLSPQLIPILQTSAWFGLAVMGACLLVATTVTALLREPEPPRSG